MVRSMVYGYQLTLRRRGGFMDDAAEVFRRVVVTLRGSDSTLH
jgi:hypothetical protein